MKKRGLILLSATLFVLVFFFVHSVSSMTNFDVSNLLLKVSLKQGESVSRTFTVSSDSGGGDFVLGITGISRGVSLEENNFTLLSGDSKIVTINFDSSELDPGVYIGGVSIMSSKEASFVPIVFEVESKDVIFDSNLDIPPTYTQIEPGGKLVAQTKIFDLVSGGGIQAGVGAVSVDLDYRVYNLDGALVSSQMESAVVDSKVQLSETVSFPDDVREGNYVLVAIVKYKNSVGISSQMFTIKSLNSGIFNGGGVSGSYILIGIVAVLGILFIGMILFFVYLIRDRDKFIVELKRYNAEELRNQKNFLLEQEKILRNRQPIEVHNKIRREVSHKLVALRRKQAERVSQIRKMKSDGDLSGIKKRLGEWKKQGYNTMFLESKLKGLSEKDMKGLMSKWKKQGYK